MESPDPLLESREAFFRKFSEDHDLEKEWMMGITDPERFPEETGEPLEDPPVINLGMIPIGSENGSALLEVITCPVCRWDAVRSLVLSRATHCVNCDE
jgi:hypothetical protein